MQNLRLLMWPCEGELTKAAHEVPRSGQRGGKSWSFTLATGNRQQLQKLWFTIWPWKVNGEKWLKSELSISCPWKLKASSKQAHRNDVRVVQVLRVLICHRKMHLIDSQFPEIVLIVRKCTGKDGWKILESALRLFWKRCVATATK